MLLGLPTKIQSSDWPCSEMNFVTWGSSSSSSGAPAASFSKYFVFQHTLGRRFIQPHAMPALTNVAIRSEAIIDWKRFKAA